MTDFATIPPFMWFLSLGLLVLGFALGIGIERIRSGRRTFAGRAAPKRFREAHLWDRTRLRDLVALMYLEANRHNYGRASEWASEYYTELHRTIEETGDPELKESLKELTRTRDAIIASLAQGDAVARSGIQDLFVSTFETTRSGREELSVAR
ncbi:MAG: hypothetical protein HY645_04320 [Acidobacteria bacterium]|nr:hypothetical protein [Acidobacteriota bacterium]